VISITRDKSSWRIVARSVISSTRESTVEEDLLQSVHKEIF
jgi:hypothetical protein